MYRWTRFAAITVAAFAASLVPAAAAGAVTRYAAGDGSGTDCTQATPCSVTTALSGTASGDTVYLTTGTYDLSSTLTVPPGVTLMGVYGTGRPFLRAVTGIGDSAISVKAGATARYLGVQTTIPGTTALKLDDAAGRDIVAWSSGGADAAVDVRTGTSSLLFQDSVAEARDGGSAVVVHDGASGQAAGLLNITAIGRVGAVGISSWVKKGTVYLENVLAHGTTDDLVLLGGASQVVTSFSNLRAAPSAIVDNGYNQFASTPCFRDWLGGDYRPIQSSPVVGVGYVDSRAPTDPWGISRSPTTDIGALQWTSDASDALGCQPLTEPPPATDTGGTGTDGSGTDSGDGSTGSDSGDSGSTGTGDSSGTGSSTGAGKTGASSLPPATPPVVGQTVTLGGSSGDLLIKLPGTNKFVPLSSVTTIPVGTTVDASSGTVTLTSAIDKRGHTQVGKFWGGTFKIGKGAGGYTELALAGDPLVCKAKAKRSKKGASRGLWGQDDHGRFRTRGRNGVATVRGTKWLTEDRCDGTYFKVAKGAIDVRDKLRRKTITVRRGHSYLVKNR